MEEDLTIYNPEGSTLRKAQLRMVDILKEIDKICRKHNIEYYMFFLLANSEHIYYYTT